MRYQIGKEFDNLITFYLPFLHIFYLVEQIHR